MLFCLQRLISKTEKLICSDRTFEVWEKAADRIHVNTRIRIPWKPERIEAADEAGNPVEVSFEWNEETRTALLSYDSRDLLVKIIGHR